MTHPAITRDGFVIQERDVAPADAEAGVIQRWAVLSATERNPWIHFVARTRTGFKCADARGDACTESYPCKHIRVVADPEGAAA